MTEGEFVQKPIQYVSLLDYSPRGQTPCSILSRRLIRDAVKTAQEGILNDAASLIDAASTKLRSRFFPEGTVLVPVPRSQPHCEFVKWPALEICRALKRAGVADSIWPGLRRTQAVQRSCQAERGKRPGPLDHSESLAVIGRLEKPSSILLVDDFVTRGATFVAAFQKLTEAFPGAEVRGFALVNTLPPGEEVRSALSLQIGEIRNRNGTLDRESWVERVESENLSRFMASR